MFVPQMHEQLSQIDLFQIAEQTLEQNSLFCSLSEEMISQLLNILQIPPPPVKNTLKEFNAIKEKLIHVLIEQKTQKYTAVMNYRLNLNEQTALTFSQIMGQLKRQYQNKCEEKQKYIKYSMYLCASKDKKQIESFHLNLFNFFKMNYFYPAMDKVGQYYNPQIPTYPLNLHNYQAVNNFSPYAFSAKNTMGPTPRQKQFPLFSHSITPKFQDQAYLHQDNIIKQKSSFRLKIGNQLIENQLKIYDEDKMINEVKQQQQQEIVLPKNDKKNLLKIDRKGESKKKNRSKMQKRQICYCNKACSENQNMKEPTIECQQCMKEVHLECLGVPSTATPRKNVKKLCPLCFIKTNNAFYQVIGEPLEILWIKQKDCAKNKINIKGKKFKQIILNKYSLQMRFLKISGHILFQWPQANIYKNKKPAQKNSNFNEIIISEQTLCKGNSDEIKINLQCLSKKGQQCSNSLIFGALFMVRRRSKQQLLAQNYLQIGQQYLKSQVDKSNQDKIKIGIFDGNLKLIEIPVRGIDCNHPEVFDLYQFIRDCIELKSYSCYYCYKKCDDLIIDRSIQQKIKYLKQMYPNPDNIPSSIFYTKEHKFEWQSLKLQQQNNQIMPAINEIGKESNSNQIEDDDDDSINISENSD